MTKLFCSLLLCVSITCAKAQTPQPTQDYGKIDKADLELKACDFEKDANAEVLFDKANIYYDQSFNIVMERHKRIKIFNDNGKDNANISLEFYSNNHFENINGVQAETFNLTDGKVEITKLDKKYTQVIDKQTSAVVFSMPNVKAGSVIEYKYTWYTTSYTNLPDWYFQDKIPVRYSELHTEIPEFFDFSENSKIFQYSKNISKSDSRTIGTTDPFSYTVYERTRALENIRSLPDEIYMTSRADNLKSILFHINSIRPPNGFTMMGNNTWAKVGGALADDDDFGRQLKRKLANEETIIAKAKSYKTNSEKIAYLFNEVKNTVKWDGKDAWYTDDGTSKAWDKKTGNSAEVNLILYHLLNASGVKAYPMIVSTREHGVVYPFNTFLYQFNRAVVYIPVDSTKKYVLDATNKYNTYSEIPYNLLNSYGFYIDKESETQDLVFLKNSKPSRQVVLINADIKADGKMTGTSQISSPGYHRINSLQRYNTDGEKKYLDYLRDDDNNLKISSIKFDDMQVDTVPLIQNLNFTLDLTGSDGNYIYFNPNLFTSLHTNPFLNENRYSDINFGYLQEYQINGSYTIPAGYKVEALPKNISMVTPDKSMTFKRIVGEQDGGIVVLYVITHTKAIYFKEDYEPIRDFYKKMQEMLNEQIVLKKS